MGGPPGGRGGGGGGGQQAKGSGGGGGGRSSVVTEDDKGSGPPGGGGADTGPVCEETENQKHKAISTDPTAPIVPPLSSSPSTIDPQSSSHLPHTLRTHFSLSLCIPNSQHIYTLRYKTTNTDKHTQTLHNPSHRHPNETAGRMHTVVQATDCTSWDSEGSRNPTCTLSCKVCFLGRCRPEEGTLFSLTQVLPKQPQWSSGSQPETPVPLLLHRGVLVPSLHLLPTLFCSPGLC